MPDLPPTPKPGEVWEAEGTRFMVTWVGDENVYWATTGIIAPQYSSHKEWSGWAIRTSARVVLGAMA